MIKKLISGISAVILAASLLTTAVFASPDDVFCFDNENSLKFWSTEGDAAVAATGFKLAISNDVAYDGAGSLAISENMSSAAENIGGGAYFTSASVGLDSLSGCTVTAKIYPVTDAVEFGAVVTMYSDGEVYIPMAMGNLKANTWQTIELKVPSNCNNTKVGFNIPLNNIYNGVVFYVDDLKITKQDNSTIPNVGDIEEPSDEIFSSMPAYQRILMIIGFVVVVAIVIVSVITVSVKSRKKYR
jgi:hypothetical protein